VTGATPLLDCFRRGEVPRDARLLAAQGALAPRAYEQLAILVLLVDDRDAEIRAAALQTLDRIPVAPLQGFLARKEVPVGLREFFADRGVFPAEIPPSESDDPLVDDEASMADPAPDTDAGPGDEHLTVVQKIAQMGFSERLKAAIKGSREVRAILIRDANKLIAASVLSSPKVSDQEIESFSRMATVSEDILRIIAGNRAWLKNYGVVVGLARNAKTPLAISMNLMSRLNDRDLGVLSIDRNVPEPLRVAARKKVVAAASGR
jgi:hypothetical protein